MDSIIHKPHLAFLHWIWSLKLKPDDVVIDATLGNGYDSLYILKHFLHQGHVYAMDVQQQALDNSFELFNKELPCCIEEKRFHPILKCHSLIETLSPFKKPKLVVYNLGYLPKGDKAKTTVTSTTLISLQKALGLLTEDGLMTIAVYPGHPEGKIEAEEILRWSKTLDHKKVQILQLNNLSHENAPFIIVFQKRD